MLSRFKMVRVLGVAIVGATLASSAYAFTNSVTVNPSNAGNGNNSVGSYTASAIHYQLDSTDFTKVDQVSFTLAPTVAAGGTVKVKVASSWYGCSGTSSITCSLSPSVALTSINNLEVSAAD